MWLKSKKAESILTIHCKTKNKKQRGRKHIKPFLTCRMKMEDADEEREKEIVGTCKCIRVK